MRTRSHLWCLLALATAACGSGDADSSSTSGAGPGPGPGPDATGVYAECGGSIVGADGTINAEEYVKEARATDTATIDCRLGPRFEEKNPMSGEDTRQELYSPADLMCSGGYLTKDVAVQAGVCPADDGGCFGSVSGQVVFALDQAEGVGVDHIQLNAWESGAITFSPKVLNAPDAFTTRPSLEEASTVSLGHPIAVARQAMSWTNDAVLIHPSGAITTAGTATSGSRGALYTFAPNLVPTAAAWTTGNEFVLVTLWNTDTQKGELAFFSVRAPTPNAHSFWYHGLMNAGGVRELKFLGTIELPFATPTSLAVATNAYRLSPHDSNQRSLSQCSFTKETCFGPTDPVPDESKFLRIDDFAPGGSYANLVATRGYAVVASRWEGKVAFVDLAPLLAYYSEMYFSSKESCEKTLSQFVYEKEHPEDIIPQSPADVWPFPFSSEAKQIPEVAAVFDVPHPRAVLAGFNKSTNYGDPDPTWKAYVASEGGTLRVYTPGSLFASYGEVKNGEGATGEPKEIGQTTICESPTAMLWNRYGGPAELMAAPPVGKGVLPPGNNDKIRSPDAYNNSLYVVCRGERKIQSVAAFDAASAVYEEFQEKRLNDPVDLTLSDRAAVWSVLDFAGKLMLTYRVGGVKIEDWKDNGKCGPQGATYSPGPTGMDRVDFGGSITFAGSPFQASFTNVN